MREKIKYVSLGLFLKRGLKRVTVDDICSALGISKKTFYNYYDQKDSLIKDVLISYIDNEYHSMLRYEAGSGNANAIDKVHFYMTYAMKNHDNTMTVFYDLIKYYKDIKDAVIERHWDIVKKNIMINILQGQTEGLYRKDFDIDVITKYITYYHLVSMNMLPTVFDINFIKQNGGFLIDAYVRLLCSQKGLKYYEELLNKK